MTKSKDELKKVGLKITAPRIKILNILESSQQRHMSAEDIYKELSSKQEDVSLATIYRVLTQFELAGIIIRHRFEEGSSVFELDKGEHHDHILCIKCGKIEEFIDDLIEQQQDKIAKQHGFKITDHSMYLYGLCKDCQ